LPPAKTQDLLPHKGFTHSKIDYGSDKLIKLSHKANLTQLTITNATISLKNRGDNKSLDTKL